MLCGSFCFRRQCISWKCKLKSKSTILLALIWKKYLYDFLFLPLAGLWQLKTALWYQSKVKSWHQDMNASESYMLNDPIALFALPSSLSLLCQREEKKTVTETRHSNNTWSYRRTRQGRCEWHYSEIVYLKRRATICTDLQSDRSLWLTPIHIQYILCRNVFTCSLNNFLWNMKTSSALICDFKFNYTETLTQ